MEPQLKAAYITTLIGSILFVLESIADYFLAGFYAEQTQDMFGSQLAGDISGAMQILAIVGLVVAVVLVVFLLLERSRLRMWHFVTVLVVAVGSIMLTSALYALIVVIIGSILGIVKVNQQ